MLNVIEVLARSAPDWEDAARSAAAEAARMLHGITSIFIGNFAARVKLIRPHYLSLAAILAFLGSATVVRAMGVNFPAGATLDGTIRTTFNTKTAQDGQRFTMMTPSRSRITGHLSEVERANFGRKAHMKLNIDAIALADGTSMPLHAEVIGISARKQTNYAQAAGTVLGGLIVGNILGKSIGTNLGGFIGVVGGTLLAVNTSQNIVIPAASVIRIKLTEPLISRPQQR